MRTLLFGQPVGRPLGRTRCFFWTVDVGVAPGRGERSTVRRTQTFTCSVLSLTRRVRTPVSNAVAAARPRRARAARAAGTFNAVSAASLSDARHAPETDRWRRFVMSGEPALTRAPRTVGGAAARARASEVDVVTQMPVWASPAVEKRNADWRGGAQCRRWSGRRGRRNDPLIYRAAAARRCSWSRRWLGRRSMDDEELCPLPSSRARMRCC